MPFVSGKALLEPTKPIYKQKHLIECCRLWRNEIINQRHLMAGLFKNIYNPEFFNEFTQTVQQVVPNFNEESFQTHIFDDDWEERELKERMRHVSTVLKEHLSDDYNQNVSWILDIIQKLQKSGRWLFRSDHATLKDAAII